MSIREWLARIGKDTAWLAAELGVTERSVRRWINGRYCPGVTRLLQIERLSGGKVTPADVVNNPSPRRAPGRPRRAPRVAA